MPPLPTILVVDDNGDASQATARILGESGYRVEQAADGAGALRTIRHLRPQLVLLEMVLPDVPGIEVLREIRADPDLAQVVVILCSSPHDRVAHQSAAMDAGADGYLVRPLHKTELLDRVRLHLRQGELSVQIHTSERRYRDLIMQMVDGVLVVDRGGLIRFANPAAERLFGRSRSLLVGSEFGAPLAGASPHQVSLQSRAHGPITVEMRAAPSDWEGAPAWIVTLNDISKRLQSEDALRKSEEKYRVLIENVNAGVFQCTLSGDFLHLNSAAAKMAGYERFEDLIGRPTSCFYADPQDRAQLKESLLRDGEVKGLELRSMRRDGSIFWISLNVALQHDGAGRPESYFGVVQDITERKRAETERVRLESQLRHAQKMESIGRLAGGVAHDFNNMLTGTMLQLNLLEGNPSLDHEARQAICELQEGTQRAARLTQQLLLYGRRAYVQMKPVRLGQIVENLLGMLQLLIGEKYRLDFSCRPQLLPVNADIGLLEQVVLNLVINARDAMPAGGDVRILTSDREWTESACAGQPERRPGRFSCISVSDTGCGIPPQNLASIFEPFFTTKEMNKGSGLGLSTVDGIVRQHNGWIEVESEVGRGSTFHVFLPVFESNLASDPSPVAAAEPGQAGHEKILLVDDELVVRKLAGRTLAQLGYRVVEADGPREALALWRDQGHSIDVLVTDMVMPDEMTGLELVHRLRAEQARLPAVVMSGYDANLFGSADGVTSDIEFLQKPFCVSALAACIRRCIERSLQPVRSS